MKRQYNHFFHYRFLFIVPILMFILEWTAIFGLHSLNLYSARHIRPETIFILSTGILFVIIGYVISTLFNTSQFNKKSSFSYLIFDLNVIQKINLILIALTLFGAVISIIEIGKLANDPLIYIKNPLRVRMIVTGIGDNIKYQPTFAYKFGSYLLNLGILTTITSSILIVKSKFKFYISSLAPFFISIISSLIFFSRYLFITYLLFYLIAIFILTQLLDKDDKAVAIKRFTSILGSSTLLICGVFFLILFARNFFIDKILDLAFKQFYFYFAGGLYSLDAYIFQIHENYTYGAAMLRGLNKWLILLGIFPDNVLTGADHNFVKINSSILLNTYTFVKAMYQDFGIVGVGFTSLFLGWSSSSILKSIIHTFSWVKLYLAIVFVFTLVMSFFGFYLESVSVIIFRLVLVLGLSFFLNKYATKRSSSLN